VIAVGKKTLIDFLPSLTVDGGLVVGKAFKLKDYLITGKGFNLYCFSWLNKCRSTSV